MYNPLLWLTRLVLYNYTYFITAYRSKLLGVPNPQGDVIILQLCIPLGILAPHFGTIVTRLPVLKGTSVREFSIPENLASEYLLGCQILGDAEFPVTLVPGTL